MALDLEKEKLWAIPAFELRIEKKIEQCGLLVEDLRHGDVLK